MMMVDRESEESQQYQNLLHLLKLVRDEFRTNTRIFSSQQALDFQNLSPQKAVETNRISRLINKSMNR